MPSAGLCRGHQQAAGGLDARGEQGRPPRVENWREGPEEPYRDLADDTLAELLAERFSDAVERQMMSDVPYGAFCPEGSTRPRWYAIATRSERPPPPSTIGFPGHAGLLDERAAGCGKRRLIGKRPP